MYYKPDNSLKYTDPSQKRRGEGGGPMPCLDKLSSSTIVRLYIIYGCSTLYTTPSRQKKKSRLCVSLLVMNPRKGEKKKWGTLYLLRLFRIPDCLVKVWVSGWPRPSTIYTPCTRPTLLFRCHNVSSILSRGNETVLTRCLSVLLTPLCFSRLG